MTTISIHTSSSKEIEKLLELISDMKDVIVEAPGTPALLEDESDLSIVSC